MYMLQRVVVYKTTVKLKSFSINLCGSFRKFRIRVSGPTPYQRDWVDVRVKSQMIYGRSGFNGPILEFPSPSGCHEVTTEASRW